MVRIWIPWKTQPIDIDQAVIRWASKHEEIGLQVVALSNGADFQLARFVERSLAQGPVSGGVSHASGDLWFNGGAGIPVHAHAARGQAEA